MVASLKADLAAQERNLRATSAKAAPIHPMHLIAAYRASVRMGGPTASAAASRLANLERDFPDAAEQLDPFEAEHEHRQSA